MGMRRILSRITPTSSCLRGRNFLRRGSVKVESEPLEVILLLFLVQIEKNTFLP
jgi:hypothetical protein